MEDKRAICNLLARTLQATRQYSDLKAIAYIAGTGKEGLFEQAHVIIGDEPVMVIDVTADSGMAMIHDIMNHL